MAGPNSYVSYAPQTGIPDLDFISTEEYNAGSEARSNEQDLKYAIFYDEGSGYLHLRDIGTGSQGRAMLVHSVADGKLYVRKIANLRDARPNVSSTFWAATEAPGQHQLEPREVSQYRPYPTIPGLVDFKTLVHCPPVTKNRDVKQFVTYWHFCNGGDLQRYIMQHSGLKERIPEIIIWRFLWQMFKTFEYLQRCQPPVSHRDIFGGNIFVHWKPDVRCRTAEKGNTEETADFDYYDTFPDHENSDMPDFYLGDFGHAVSTYRAPKVRRKRFRYDIDSISEVFKKLVFCTANSLEAVEMNGSVIRDRSYSADLAGIWEEISLLKSRFLPCSIADPELLDMKPLENFIKTLGRLYPKTYSNPTVKFTRPASIAPPALFISKEQLLSRYGTMLGGPWYICTINANHEIRVIKEEYGLPGQAPPPRVLKIMNPDDIYPPARPGVPIPTATAYFPQNWSSDPESSSSQDWAIPVTTCGAVELLLPQLAVQTQMMNPQVTNFTTRSEAFTPVDTKHEVSFEDDPAQPEVPLKEEPSQSEASIDRELQEAMDGLCEGSWRNDEDDNDDMYGSLR